MCLKPFLYGLSITRVNVTLGECLMFADGSACQVLTTYSVQGTMSYDHLYFIFEVKTEYTEK